VLWSRSVFFWQGDSLKSFSDIIHHRDGSSLDLIFDDKFTGKTFIVCQLVDFDNDVPSSISYLLRRS